MYSEDPTTVAALGHAYVQGIQHGDVGAPSTDILLIASSPKQCVQKYPVGCCPRISACLPTADMCGLMTQLC